MKFPGRFPDQLVADKLDKVALSFLVDELEIRRGGVAANIAFGLGCLGLRPLLVGSVGRGLRRVPRLAGPPRGGHQRGAGVGAAAHRPFRRHDRPGRGTRSARSTPARWPRTWRSSSARWPVRCDLVLIGATDPDAMLQLHRPVPRARHAVRRRPVLAAGQVRRTAGARAGRRGRVPVLQRVRGRADRAEDRLDAGRGAQPRRDQGDHAGRRRRAGGAGRDEPRCTCPGMPDAEMAEPTGAGDAFRAGFLAAVAWGCRSSAPPSSATCSPCTRWRPWAPRSTSSSPPP